MGTSDGKKACSFFSDSRAVIILCGDQGLGYFFPSKLVQLQGFFLLQEYFQFDKR
jgi:hypothetical protein